MAEPNIGELELDLKELESLFEQAKRSAVKDLIGNKISQNKAIIQNAIKKPKKIENQPAEEVKATQANKDSSTQKDDNIIYMPITSYSFDQENDKVKIIISLDGIGELDASNFAASFQEQSVDFKIRNYQNKNLRFGIPKLMGTIDTKTSKYIVKKNYITITLNKKEKKHWDQLVFKESSLKDKDMMDKNQDPQASMMNMMKKMYEEGDEEMKRTIAKAWTESQDKKKKEPF